MLPIQDTPILHISCRRLHTRPNPNISPLPAVHCRVVAGAHRHSHRPSALGTAYRFFICHADPLQVKPTATPPNGQHLQLNSPTYLPLRLGDSWRCLATPGLPQLNALGCQKRKGEFLSPPPLDSSFLEHSSPSSFVTYASALCPRDRQTLSLSLLHSPTVTPLNTYLVVQSGTYVTPVPYSSPASYRSNSLSPYTSHRPQDGQVTGFSLFSQALARDDYERFVCRHGKEAAACFSIRASGAHW